MKKLLVIMMCLIIFSTNRSATAFAAGVSGVEIIDCQYASSIGLMSSDVIQYKYRQYNNRMQYRRWNVTRQRWVDPYWIYV